jgi:hypothetical protein
MNFRPAGPKFIPKYKLHLSSEEKGDRGGLRKKLLSNTRFGVFHVLNFLDNHRVSG